MLLPASEAARQAALARHGQAPSVVPRDVDSRQRGAPLSALQPALLDSIDEEPSAKRSKVDSKKQSIAHKLSSWVSAGFKLIASPAQARRKASLGPGASALNALVISDDDEPAPPLAAPLPPQAAQAARGASVELESRQAWVGVLRASHVRVRFTADAVALWAQFADGSSPPLHFDLPVAGFVTELAASFALSASDSWPLGWRAMLTLKSDSWPSPGSHRFYDPESGNPQRATLLCLLLDNSAWRGAQREICAFPAWAAVWRRLSLEEQQELQTGRLNVGQLARPSAHQRSAARRDTPVLPPDGLTYPEGDLDSVIITAPDLRRLDPGELLNDTLVDFGMYRVRDAVAAAVGAEEAGRRFHFCSSFFFKLLLAAGEGAATQDKVYARVARWTAGTDLFEKEAVFIPVHQGLHWSLLVVLHPGAATTPPPPPPVHDLTGGTEVIVLGDEPEGPSPAILHLNSLRGTHTGMEPLLRGYLAREWAARRNKPLAEAQRLFAVVPSHTPDVPQQPNSVDCGLFTIEFAGRFTRASAAARAEWRALCRPGWFAPEAAGVAKRDAIYGDIVQLAAKQGGGR